jgi:DNA repair protein RecO (recombination protein O)
VNQLQTRGIVLSRTAYGEADRIVTLITPDQGKVRVMARGVRKLKSKLAGGIELFTVSDITYIPGKGEIGTLISSRMYKNFGNIVKDIERVQLGYELIKLLNKATEDHPESKYYELLEHALEALNDAEIELELIRTWFHSQLLQQAGHALNLKTDTNGNDLAANQKYNFDYEAMAFTPHQQGSVKADHIKTLRLLFSNNSPTSLKRIAGLTTHLKAVTPLVRTMLTSHIRV